MSTTPHDPVWGCNCRTARHDPDCAGHRPDLDARPMCVHADGTEHPCEQDDDGLYGPCDDAVSDEPTVENVIGLLTDAVSLLDGAATQLAELMSVERDRRLLVLDIVWEGWAHAERARGLLARVPGE